MEHPDRLFLDFQSALAGRYSLERELGRGGMGVVYLARADLGAAREIGDRVDALLEGGREVEDAL